MQIAILDIQLPEQNGIVLAQKLLGVESHSLSSDGTWKKAISAVRQRNWEELLPVMFMLSTDGFSNSFASDGQLYGKLFRLF